MSERQVTAPRQIPWAMLIACLSLAGAGGLAVGGVYVLCGLGWSLIAGSMACAAFGFVIVRGLR